MDPVRVLTDELMIHVFSFVGGQVAKTPTEPRKGEFIAQKQEEESFEYVEEEVTDEEAEKLKNEKKPKDDKNGFLDVKDAGRFYFSIAKVSRVWKRIIDGVMPHLAYNIAVQYDSDWIAPEICSCFEWLKSHKLNIGSMSGPCSNTYQGNCLPSSNYTYLPDFIGVLRACDTKNLKDLTFVVQHGEGLEHDFIPVRQFLDEIAKQCPNLATVYITILCNKGGLSSNDPSFFSPAFFSLPSLRTLHLGIVMGQPAEVDSLLLTRLIEGLSNLEYLFLNSQYPTLGGDGAHTVFPIRSTSLKQILAENFTKQIKFSLDCPKLEFYRCKGFVAHTPQPGQVPQRIALYQHVVEAHNVPESCYALVIHVCNPMGPPIGFPFQYLLGPTATMLPLRNPHR